MLFHKTTLKIVPIVMLLRNLDAKNGLCNGAHLIIAKMSSRVLQGRVLTGEFEDQTRLIPRVTLDSSKSSSLPFTLSRLQFPVRLAVSMTIVKSQGQSVEYVGSSLLARPSSHGQLTSVCPGYICAPTKWECMTSCKVHVICTSITRPESRLIPLQPFAVRLGTRCSESLLSNLPPSHPAPLAPCSCPAPVRAPHELNGSIPMKTTRSRPR